MKPIKFDGQNQICHLGNQGGYLPSLRVKDMVTSCWKLTWQERLQVLFTGKIWAVMRAFRKPPMALLLAAKRPFKIEE